MKLRTVRQPRLADMEKYFLDSAALLLDEARIQQLMGEHWDDPPFLVGAAAVAWSPFGYKIGKGHNYKPIPGKALGKPRCCAEEEYEGELITRGASKIIGVVMAACYQPDDITGKDMRGTLPPCEQCRIRMAKSVMFSGLYSLNTRFIHHRVDRPFYTPTKCVEYTLKELFEEFPVDPHDLLSTQGTP